MILIWGSRFYGKVDQVPGPFYVVTRFGHLSLIPLIPLETVLILDTPGERGERGRRIPMSGKSVFAGWLRAACVLAMAISGAFVVVGLMHLTTPGRGAAVALVSGVWFVVSGALLVLSYLLSRASPERAVALGTHLGIPEEAMQDLLTPKDERLKQLEAYLSANPDALERVSRRARRDKAAQDDAAIRRGRPDYGAISVRAGGGREPPVGPEATGG
jgi:hypothetical protein